MSSSKSHSEEPVQLANSKATSSCKTPSAAYGHGATHTALSTTNDLRPRLLLVQELQCVYQWQPGDPRGFGCASSDACP